MTQPVGSVLVYGSYAHAAGECAVQIINQPIFENGARRHLKQTWVINGRIQADSQTALTAALHNLQNIYSNNNQDLVLKIGQAATVHTLRSSDTLGGIRVTQLPTYENGAGAEYSTFRTYTIRVEGDIPDMNVQTLAWKEAVRSYGGGPQFMFLECLNGAPVQQQIKEEVIYRATQTGEAVGMFTWPQPPSPIWPDFFKQDISPGVEIFTPDRAGIYGGNRYTGFRITWSYVFESNFPLVGLPTPWPNA